MTAMKANSQSTRKTSNNFRTQVNSSDLVVWRNEDRNLIHFSFTSLTKTLVVINVKQNDNTQFQLT
jgi:hypothetical protein